MPRTNFPCLWLACQQHFEDPEDLFIHLSDDHVGRKATNNLCLQCQWNGGGTDTVAVFVFGLLRLRTGL